MSDMLNEAQNLVVSLRNSNKKQTGKLDELVIDPYFEEDPDIAMVVEFAIKRRKNLLIVGPTGCGKSSLAINVMARLKEKGEIFSLDGETSTDQLIGKLIVAPNDKGILETKVVYGAALRAYKEGKGLILEEVDIAVPDVLASLHRILETHSNFYVCNIGEEEIISKSKNFFVIATANTIGTGEDTFLYAGTKPLNMAFMNRFSLTVKMGYLDKNREIKVLINKMGIGEDIAEKLVLAANDVRDAADPSRISGTPGSQKLVSTISTRDLLEWSDAIVGMNMDPLRAAECAFLARTTDTDRDVIRTFIQNRI